MNEPINATPEQFPVVFSVAFLFAESVFPPLLSVFSLQDKQKH